MRTRSLHPLYILGALLALDISAVSSVDAQQRERVVVTRQPRQDDPRVGQPTPQQNPRGPVVHQVWEPPSITEPARPQPVVVRTTPPAPRRVARPRAPRGEHVWVEGYWSWNGSRYVWMNGRWEPARTNQVWVQPQWQQSPNGGWIFVEGYWTTQPAPQQQPYTPHPQQPPQYVAPQPQQPAQRSFEAEIIDACSRATVGSSSQNDCVQRARPLGMHARRTIEACGAQTVGNGALVDCLGAVRTATQRTPDIVAACGRATVGNGATVACVSAATGARTDPVPVIESCARSTVGNSNFQSCVSGSVR